MSSRRRSPRSGRRPTSTGSSGTGPTLPPIHMASAYGIGNPNQLHQQQQQQSSALDTVIGTGTGNASSADNFGIAALSGVRKDTVSKQNASSGALVDFMTFAEAPAFFDLPIPLYIAPPVGAPASPSQQQNQNSPSNSQQEFLGSSESASFFSDEEYHQQQRQRELQQRELEARAKKHESKFLQPLEHFNTQEQLRALDFGANSPIIKDYYSSLRGGDEDDKNKRGFVRRRAGDRNKNRASSHQHNKKRNQSSNNNNNINNQNSSRSKFLDPPQPTSRVVLPRMIAEMVHSLRPTHYAPLRKAMRTRSQERVYEGDDDHHEQEQNQPHDASSSEQQNAEQVYKKQQQQRWEREEQHEGEMQRQATATRAVASWQDDRSRRGAEVIRDEATGMMLSVPARGASGGGGRSSSQAGGGAVSFDEHLPFYPSVSPVPSAGGGSAISGAGAGGSGGVEPHLATIHAGRRASIATTPFVGDLGQPSRTLPTHGRVNLLNFKDNVDSNDDDNNNNRSDNQNLNNNYFQSQQSQVFDAEQLQEAQAFLTTELSVGPWALRQQNLQNTQQHQHSEFNEEAYNHPEPVTLLARATPRRHLAAGGGGQHHRASVAVAAQEQSNNRAKQEEFHRDLMRWYRTENTLLKLAL